MLDITEIAKAGESNVRDFMLQSIAEGLGASNKGLEIAKNLTCAEFCAKYMRTEKDLKVDFDKRPYLVKLYNDLSPEQVYMKASQVGATAMFMNKMIYMSLKQGLTIIFTLPTSGDAGELSASRFNPSMRFSEIGTFFNADIDNVKIKQINNSYIYFRGTWNERQAISIPADLNIHDELNFSRPDIIGIFQPRLGASNFKGTWLASTPTMTKFLIDKEFENSNKQFWMIPCPKCKKEQHIIFENIKKLDGIYKYCCKFCGAEITEDDKLKGRWLETKKHKRNGYFMNRLLVYGETAQVVYDKYEKAKEKNKLNIFYNFVLGLPYVEETSRVLNWDIFAIKCAKDYDLITASKNSTIMGVDQGDNLHITIADTKNIRKIIYLEMANNFERVEQLIRLFNVGVAVIDALPNKHSARKVRDKFPGKVFLNYYNDSIKKDWQQGNEVWEIVSNRTTMLDITAYEKMDGKCEIPKLNIPIVKEFVTQSCNMVREIVEDKHGIKKVVWNDVGADHWRHSDLYCYLAGLLLKKALRSKVSVSVL